MECLSGRLRIQKHIKYKIFESRSKKRNFIPANYDYRKYKVQSFDMIFIQVYKEYNSLKKAQKI